MKSLLARAGRIAADSGCAPAGAIASTDSRRKPWLAVLLSVAVSWAANVAHAQTTFDDNLIISDVAPQLFFSDTSSPTYIWKILADDEGFAITDYYSASIFIEPGAPTFSTFIASNGWIGLGTSSPVANLHIATGDIVPKLRWESQSVAPHIWDLEASVQGLYFTDVTNSVIPFGIQPGAPTDSLFVDLAGNVGFGTGSPTAPIHARKKAQSGVAETIARFEISDDSIGNLEIGNVSSGNGIFHPRLRGTTASQAVALTMEGLITTDAGLNPVVAYDAARKTGGAVVTRPLVVFRNNGTPKVTIAANGNVTATSFITASSRSLKDKIAELPSDKASAALRQLTPVEFVYKDDAGAEPRVGFIAEDVPELIAEPDRMSVPVMDIVALVTRVVKDQQQTIDEQKKALDAQQAFIEEQRKLNELLIKRLNELENQVTASK